MKFKRIVIKNFMRYEGENTINFSCDNDKNVTVVLGDNTFGKTTISQAFRWCLYGEVINTQYDNSKKIELLSFSVIDKLLENESATVSVILQIEDDDIVYEIVRNMVYTKSRNRNKENTILRMRRKTNGIWGDFISDEKSAVSDAINSMFPKALSNYIFFDGERWNEEKSKLKDVKSSIKTILGIVPLQNMKYHLIEMGSGGKNSVIKKISKKTYNNDFESQKLTKQQDDLNNDIEVQSKISAESEKNAENFEDKARYLKEILASNSKIIEEQKKYDDLSKDIKIWKNEKEKHYSNLVKIFSRDGYKTLLEPLLYKSKKILDKVELEGKDIPGVDVKTIDYLLNNGVCLCGTELVKGSKEYETLLSLKKAVPPEQIGLKVGTYINSLENMISQSKNVKKDLEEVADNLDKANETIEHFENKLGKLEDHIDSKIHFENSRIKLRKYEEEVSKYNKLKREAKYKVEKKKEELAIVEKNLEQLVLKNKANEHYFLMNDYANELLRVVNSRLDQEENNLLSDLNSKVKENYKNMFSEKDKIVELKDDYKIHTYINDENIKREVHNLSEGEKIELNFVLIVSILQLAKEKKCINCNVDDSCMDDLAINLPLVLDGPFSKLSSNNIGLVAKALPSSAEQIIIFMLEKDWDASDLEKYTLPEFKYLVSKEKFATSSKINNF